MMKMMKMTIDNNGDDCNCGISLTFAFIQNEDWGDWGHQWPGNGPPARQRPIGEKPQKAPKVLKTWPLADP